MKRFTLKDFVLLNSPCMGCEAKITLQIGVQLSTDYVAPPTYLSTTITKDYTLISLLKQWTGSLAISIDHKTNRFAADHSIKLAKYLDDHELFLWCQCERNCGTYMISDYLEFDHEKGFVKPVSISAENIIVHDTTGIYQISSQYEENRSSILIDCTNKVVPLSAMCREVPLLPHYKFKNRQHFLDKMKLYTLLS